MPKCPDLGMSLVVWDTDNNCLAEDKDGNTLFHHDLEKAKQVKNDYVREFEFEDEDDVIIAMIVPCKDAR